MKKEHICIYHKDCVDGTTAAAVVLRRFPNARMFPLSHGYAPEEIETILDITDSSTHIYIVDSVLGLHECALQGNRITIIDHHISEYERTVQFAQEHPHIEYIFDNAKSGASLAWEVLFPNESVPRLIQLVEDRDLWLEKYGTETEHVNNYLSLWRNDPQKITDLLDQDIQSIISQGEPITITVHTEVAKSILLEPLMVTVGNHTVPAYNITNHQSMCGNVLARATQAVVGLYTIDGNHVRFSFRSRDAHIPSALDIALLLDGGGHRNISGARMKLKNFLESIIH